MNDLAIIIVSWNVCALLRECLRGVQASLAGSGLRYEILVVDNASSDGSPAMVRDEFPDVRLIERGRNLGFTAGNNLALRELGFGQIHDVDRPSMVLLLNPDTVPQGDAIPALVRYLDADHELVLVGPQLRYADGSVQSSRRRFPTMATFFWESTPLERLWPANPWARRYRCADQRDDRENRVGWLVGAALLVRGSAIERAGLLDERFFMYSEELEWQWRLQGAGHTNDTTSRIVYLPSAVIVHHEGRSSEQVLARRHSAFQRSKLLLAQMMYGSFFSSLLRSFLFLCYVWELLVETAKFVLGHRRDLRRQRIGVYAQVLHGLMTAATHT